MFFFLPMPMTRILLLYVLAAVVPALFLMRYIDRHDTIEKEPASLLGSLVLCGVGAALAASVVERVGEWILNSALSQSSPYYLLVLAFVVVGAVEEGAKLLFLKMRTWKDWNFTHLFDGVVYSAFVSLGFAAYENIRYVFSYGLSVALPRALFAIPGHLGFSVFMGVFYGRAKLCENRGDPSGRNKNLVLGYLSAVLLHGVYDACAMSGSGLATVIFYVFVAVMYFVVYRMVKRASETDRPVY